ncbi:MAG TPA: hypothetical protein VHG08_20370 [Longimicrobium sp.]|nr:hypothetical protein [Longimicrobium sp.]
MGVQIQASGPLGIEWLTEASGSFPGPRDALAVEREPEAEMQMSGGLVETVLVALDPDLIRAFVGVAGAGAALKIGAKVGELVVEDLYKWVKEKVFGKGCEELALLSRHWVVQPGSGSAGVRVHVYSTDKEEINVIHQWVYFQKPGKPFERRAWNAQMRAYEHVIKAALAAAAQETAVRRLIVQGFIGPATDEPRWSVLTGGTPSPFGPAISFPEVLADGTIEWDSGTPDANQLLKDVLSKSPPIVGDDELLYHWADCEALQAKRAAAPDLSVTPFLDAGEARENGFRACLQCF